VETRGTEIEHEAHTVFAVRREGVEVAIDPVRDDRPLAPDLDAVVISHVHDDHLHPPTLLTLPATTPIYCFDEAVERRLHGLGFTEVVRVRGEDAVELPGSIAVTRVPAAPSLDGVEQCALLVETPDVVMLDGVDIRDSPPTRAALAEHRGQIDVAFLPTGASLQWNGCWNQMDALQAVELASWLDVELVAPCGGTLSSSAAPRLGRLERYPVTRAEWLAVAARHLPTSRILSVAPPVRLHYLSGERVAVRRRVINALPPAAVHLGVPLALAAFFSGYDRRSPMLPLRGPTATAVLESRLRSWQGCGTLLVNGVDQLATLIERCHPAENNTAAAVVLRNCLRALHRAEHHGVASEICVILPDPGDPDEAARQLLDTAEGIIRREIRRGSPLHDALRCVALDRALAALERERCEMHRRGRPTPVTESDVAAFVCELRRSAAHRRPVLTPHHLWLDAHDAEPLLGEVAPEETQALLYHAHPDGVRRMSLGLLEALVLQRCDGRTVEDLAVDIASALGSDVAVARAGVVDILLAVTTASVQLVDWTG
jgi:L-ascorbate metabolism protein UlaG (beta-lactamase superfamily)